jgi:hypothetical protein
MSLSMSHLITPLGLLALAASSMVGASGQAADSGAEAAPVTCTSSGNGYLKGKIAGAIAAEIDWGDKGTTCTGEARPQGGVRVSFKNTIAPDQPLLIVFGIPGAREGRPGKALPVNLTVVREGSAQFFSTQGDDKCTIDRLEQRPLRGPPYKERRYRITVRGFCTEPAREVQGDGAVLMSRFDFATELHFREEEAAEPAPDQTVL